MLNDLSSLILICTYYFCCIFTMTVYVMYHTYTIYLSVCLSIVWVDGCCVCVRVCDNMFSRQQQERKRAIDDYNMQSTFISYYPTIIWLMFVLMYILSFDWLCSDYSKTIPVYACFLIPSIFKIVIECKLHQFGTPVSLKIIITW